MRFDKLTIKSQEEDEFVDTELFEVSGYFGISDHIEEGTFVWVDGTTFDPAQFDGWCDNEPNNTQAGSDQEFGVLQNRAEGVCWDDGSNLDT